MEERKQNKFATWIIEKVSRWLLQEEKPRHGYLSDFTHVTREIRPTDVILIDGRSRASLIIKHVTQSSWSHAVLYIGRLQNIDNPELEEEIRKHGEFFDDQQLIIETEIGLGTIVSPLSKYQFDHMRILRPRGLTRDDKEQVISFAAHRLGRKYNLRHLWDMARFMFPWGLWPHNWRPMLFQQNALQPTEDICSTMIAKAFESISYPILPLISQDEEKNYELMHRNPNLFTPSDFDYSPYFDVIKYPIFPLTTEGDYHRLRWKEGYSDS